MKLSPNDPKLTALVLGELAGEEAAEIRQAVDADPELRAEVDAIRATVAAIEAAMHDEPLPGVLSVDSVNARSGGVRPRRGRLFRLSVVAAALLLVAAVALPFLPGTRDRLARYLDSDPPTLPAPLHSNRRTPDLPTGPKFDFAVTKTPATAAEQPDVAERLEMPRSVRGSDLQGSGAIVPTPPERSSESPTARPEFYGDSVVGGAAVDRDGVLALPESQPVEVPRRRRPGRKDVKLYPMDDLVPDAPSSSTLAAPPEGPPRRSDRAPHQTGEPSQGGTDQLADINFQQARVEDVEKLLGQLEQAAGEQSREVVSRFREQIKQNEAQSKEQAGRRPRGRAPAPSGEAEPKPDYIVGKRVYETPTPNAKTGKGKQELHYNLGQPVYSATWGDRSEVPRGPHGVYGAMGSRQGEERLNISGAAPVVREDGESSLRRERRDPFDAAGAEAYKKFVENDFLRPQDAPFSTFSVDVDTAAYSTMRRYVLGQNRRPPVDSVRLEEYVNYFRYDYAPPTDGKPFAAHIDVAACPWASKHLLARIGIKGREYPAGERPALNLVFLIDTSGSMSSSKRLPLVKRGLTELVEMLQDRDRVAVVTYAGSSRLALPSVSGREKRAILDVVESLDAAGSTAGGAGIKTAYETARKYYDAAAQNRVILCTDGDFNVGVTDNAELERMIGEEAKSGVFLTVLGFGMGNYKDERLKTLSMRGNGNFGYVDSFDEARRLLVEDLAGTLLTIAKDVKIQVDFNPDRVAAYRLLGYENRKLRDEDFHDDRVDGGDIGAGHTVTALYEIVPAGTPVPRKVDESRYGGGQPDAALRGLAPPAHEKEPSRENELMFVKLRYKEPGDGKSELLEYPVVFAQDSQGALSPDGRFAAAVALYGMLLRQSRYSGDGTFDTVLELAAPGAGEDRDRREFLDLVRKAKGLSP